MKAPGTSVDFFISYNSGDRRWAEWIAWQAEGAGFSTVIQEWDFTPGANFVAEMHDALTKAHRIVAVLSPNYLKSEFAFSEWASAFACDPRGAARKLIPVRVETCQPEGLLGQVVYIDLTGKSEDAAKQALLEGLKSGRAKPSSPPDFPAHGQIQAAPAFPAVESTKAPTGDVYEVDIGDRNRDIVIGKNNLTLKSRQP